MMGALKMLQCGLKNVNSKYAQMAVLTNIGILITLFFFGKKNTFSALLTKIVFAILL